MKKIIIVILCLSCYFYSCKQNINYEKQETDLIESGMISGQVLYSNLEESNYGGIIVTLEKTDGLRTASVNRSIITQRVNKTKNSLIGTQVTEDDGTYFFDNLVPGTYTVYASSHYSKEKAVYTNLVVRSGETTIAEPLRLIATGNINGRITVAGRTTGNIGFLVFVAGTSYMAMTDDAGNYTISDIPAGNGYQIVVTKNNIIHFLNSDVTVTANETTTIETNSFANTEINGMKWLGIFNTSDEITNPNYLDAFFNSSDGCTYFYDGFKWVFLGYFGTSALAIGTVLSTESPTNQNVIISINITKSNISKIGYVYSSTSTKFTNAKAVLMSKDFINIEPDVDGKYQINASLNGYYTVAAKDSEGYVTYIEEYISNIDKTPPATVSNLNAHYDRKSKTISVSWTNPADNDIDFVYLSYKRGGDKVVSDFKVSDVNYLVHNVDVDGKAYEFSLCVVDNAGNISVSSSTRIIPSNGAYVQAISLNRYHIAYNDPDQTITAVATIINADLIDDETIVKFQTKDFAGNVTNTIATVDKELGTATATIIAPSSGYNSTSATYTVFCKIGENSADITHSSRFNVSSAANIYDVYILEGEDISNKKQIALSDVSNSSKEIIRIEGYNLDLVKPCIQLYGEADTPYFTQPIEVDTRSIQWTANSGENYQLIDTEINVPNIDDVYTVKILFDGKIQVGYITQLQVYDEPKFSKLEIPKVSYKKEDNSVIATIVGKNFDTPIINANHFIATCSSNPSIVRDTKYIIRKDNTIDVSFTIPGNIGDYSITISYGKESVTGTLSVRDYSNYSVGDVLMDDGTIIPYHSDNLTFTNAQKKNAVSVLSFFNQYGAPVGLGLYNSAGGTKNGDFMWVPPSCSFVAEYFIGIQCIPSKMDCSGAASEALFTGDADGSDNWTYICSVDQFNTIEAEKYYPAFNYVNNYANTFGLTKEYATGWYMPSLPELCYIYRNIEILNAVLYALDGVQLSNEGYWSSSLYSYYDSGNAWWVDFSEGSIVNRSNYNSCRVCCVRLFD